MGIALSLHLYIGWIFMLANFVLAAWAYRYHRRRQPLPPRFWRAQAGTIHLFVLQIVVGLVLLWGFHLHPPTRLHFLYAALATLTVAAEALLDPRRSLGRMVREEGQLKEAGTYAVLTLLAAVFALRLLMTGLGLP